MTGSYSETSAGFDWTRTGTSAGISVNNSTGTYTISTSWSEIENTKLKSEITRLQAENLALRQELEKLTKDPVSSLYTKIKNFELEIT